MSNVQVMHHLKKQTFVWFKWNTIL